MPTSQTPNYQLSQWERSDRILMEDFNADNAKIDAALKAEASTRASAVNTLTSKVNKCGNCSIGLLTYKGTGTPPNIIQFPRKPTAFIVCGFGGILVGRGDGIVYTAAGSQATDPTWNGNQLSFTLPGTNIQQMNSSGSTYYVLAFYAED